MNKEIRASIIRTRFKSKFGHMRWATTGKPCRQKPKANAIDPGWTLSRPIAPKSYQFKEWLKLGDKKAKVTVRPERTVKGPLAVTRIALEMYRWNRMSWNIDRNTNGRYPNPNGRPSPVLVAKRNSGHRH